MAVLLAGGCTSQPPRVVVDVFAASSLGELASDLEAAFETEHPQVDIQVHLAGSQVLRMQIAQGAPADVFLSANAAHLDALDAAELVLLRRPLATNDLVVIVPAEDPDAIRNFADLPRAERIVLGTPQVPIGRYARQVLDKVGGAFAAGVRAKVVSEENNVRLIRAKVALGEADAAFVYRTDAIDVPGIRVIDIPPEHNVRAVYHGATIQRPKNTAYPAEFLGFVGTAAGEAILARRGFVPVP